MAAQTELIIVLEGGLISAIVSNDPEAFKNMKISVIDYDVEGADEIVEIEQGNGEFAPACLHVEQVGEAAIPVPLITRESTEDDR